MQLIKFRKSTVYETINRIKDERDMNHGLISVRPRETPSGFH